MKYIYIIYIYINIYDGVQRHNRSKNKTITRYCILDVTGNSYLLPIYLCVPL